MPAPGESVYRSAPRGEHLLPRAHRAVSNRRRGCTAPIAGPHLSTYRRTWTSSSFATTAGANPHAAFQTLLGLNTRHEPVTYRQIIDQAT